MDNHNSIENQEKIEFIYKINLDIIFTYYYLLFFIFITIYYFININFFLKEHNFPRN